jgi:hypothetical protein
MHFCFVSTRRGSYFMTELMAALAAAVEAGGDSAEVVLDGFPRLREDVVYVVVPHEFDAWGSASGSPDREQRARTIALCTENPGTSWFETTAELVAGFGASVSINRSSAAELRRRGIRCEHLQLGYVPEWDSWQGADAGARDIDVLYLGAADPRRDPLLGAIGTQLWARRCQFLVPPLEPRTGPRPDFLVGRDKYARLGGAKILLNLHRTTSAALEWMRFLEAICNGCVVVSEPCLDGEPLIAGQHYVQATADRMADTINELLDDPRRLRALGHSSYEFVRARLPMHAAAKRLTALAAELLPGSVAGAAPSPQLDDDSPPPQTHAARQDRRPGTGTAYAAAAHEPPGDSPHTVLANVALGIRQRLHRGDAPTRTPAYDAAAPHVTALGVVASGHESENVALLQSVAENTFSELEILVATDARRGPAGRRLQRLFADHPAVAMRMVDADVADLAATRNLLAEHARGEHLLTLTGGGAIFPSAVARLAQALDADSDAFFAYPMIAVIDQGVPVGLRGSLPWEPERLTRENWIDPPALIRRDSLLSLGGYSSEPQLRGLEDYELWCRCACATASAVHVPQVLGWHSHDDNARPLVTASLPPGALALLRQRFPALFGEQATSVQPGD